MGSRANQCRAAVYKSSATKNAASAGAQSQQKKRAKIYNVKGKTG
jgi:hypothetical protein